MTQTSIRTSTFIFCFLTFLALAVPARALDAPKPTGEPGQWALSLGAEYMTGDYGGATTTRIWSFPLRLQYETRRSHWWVTLPYLIVDGPGDVVISGRNGPSGRRPTAGTTRRTERGMGDVSAGMSYRLRRESAYGPALDLGGAAYIGTADETKRLGTGENDYAVQLDVSKSFSSWTWSGTLGYLIAGSPADIVYKNVFYGRVEVFQEFEHRTLGMALDAQGASVPGNDAPAKLIAYVSTAKDIQPKLTGYLMGGISSASPDWGGGMSLSLHY
jgi:hypothetical protein